MENVKKQLEAVKGFAERLLEEKRKLMVSIELLSDESKTQLLSDPEIQLLNAENKVLFKML
jgi:hypothetical protein